MANFATSILNTCPCARYLLAANYQSQVSKVTQSPFFGTFVVPEKKTIVRVDENTNH
jgi:hypothetical protein